MLSLAWLVGVAVVVELCVIVHGSHEHECALSWHLDLFVAGWRPGRVQNRLQRGTICLGQPRC